MRRQSKTPNPATPTDKNVSLFDKVYEICKGFNVEEAARALEVADGTKVSFIMKDIWTQGGEFHTIHTIQDVVGSRILCTSVNIEFWGGFHGSKNVFGTLDMLVCDVVYSAYFWNGNASVIEFLEDQCLA